MDIIENFISHTVLSLIDETIKFSNYLFQQTTIHYLMATSLRQHTYLPNRSESLHWAKQIPYRKTSLTHEKIRSEIKFVVVYEL